MHVVFECLLREAGVRVDPGHQEHGEALIDRPFDEGFFRREVENVELVDPRRHDQQGSLVDLCGRGRILDQLDEVVLKHDLARGHGQVPADLEGRKIRLADAQQILRLLEVLNELGHAAHQILGIGGERSAHHLGIGQCEVRRRQRRQHLVQVEQRLLARLLIDTLGVAGEVLGPARGDEISLLPEIEVLTVRPIGVLEAVVAGLRLDHRLDVLAEKPAEGAAPQIGIAPEQLALRRSKFARLGHPMTGDLAQRLGRLAGLRGHAVGATAVRIAAFGQSREGFGPLVEQAHHIAG